MPKRRDCTSRAVVKISQAVRQCWSIDGAGANSAMLMIASGKAVTGAAQSDNITSRQESFNVDRSNLSGFISFKLYSEEFK